MAIYLFPRLNLSRETRSQQFWKLFGIKANEIPDETNINPSGGEIFGLYNGCELYSVSPFCRNTYQFHRQVRHLWP